MSAANSVLELNEPPICLALKTRTLFVVGFAPGKACRQAIGVNLIALRAIFDLVVRSGAARRKRVRLVILAGATGLEPAASCVTGRRSNQLNYDRA